MPSAQRRPRARTLLPRDLVERVERRLLARFLGRFADFLAASSIDLVALAATHQDDRALVHRVYETLHAPDREPPEALLDELLAIAAVANPSTCEQLVRLDEAGSLPRGSLGCEDLAFTAFLDHPELFARARPFASVSATRGYSECEPLDARPFPSSRALLDQLEAAMGRELEGRSRTRYCKVLATTRPDELVVDVAFGKLPAARDRVVAREEALRVEQETRVHTESARVLVDRSTGRIALSGLAFMKEMLRHHLGAVLFGDPGFYRGRSLVTLEPLREDLDGALSPDGVAGLVSVELRSITLKRGDHAGPTYPAGPTGDARDTIDAMHLREALEWEGSVSHATFALGTTHRRQPTPLAVRARDAHLEFDRSDARLEAIVREWLVARGMFDLPLREAMRTAG